MRSSRTWFEVRGTRCAATLHTPDGTGRFPTLVMAHGLGGTVAMGLQPYAEAFTAHGYACLIFDYRHWGESDGQPRGMIRVRSQLEDWRAAVDHARTLDEVDAVRVGLWGTSFSGGHVLTVAAARDDIACVLAQGPFTSGTASSLAVGPVTSLRLGLAVARDLTRTAVGRTPYRVAVAGEPGSVALMTAPDALVGYSALLPPGEDALSPAPARAVLEVMRYHPGRQAARVTCPLFVAVCDDDSVAPSRATLRWLRRATTAEVVRYDHGHFDIYRGTAFDEVVADQLAFLGRVLPS